MGRKPRGTPPPSITPDLVALVRYLTASGVGFVAVLVVVLAVYAAYLRPDVACGALVGGCSELAPPSAPSTSIPSKPLEGQAVSENGKCPEGYAVINGGCWLQASKQPPCPVLTYESGGHCWTPLMVPPTKRPNATE